MYYNQIRDYQLLIYKEYIKSLSIGQKLQIESTGPGKQISNIVYPSIEILNDEYDEIMTAYKLVPDVSEIIKKLKLKKQQIKGKHRYIYFNTDKKHKKLFLKNFKLTNQPYPKGKNKRYSNTKLQNLLL